MLTDLHILLTFYCHNLSAFNIFGKGYQKCICAVHFLPMILQFQWFRRSFYNQLVEVSSNLCSVPDRI